MKLRPLYTEPETYITYEVVLRQERSARLTVSAQSTEEAEDLALQLAEDGEDLGETLEDSWEVLDSEVAEQQDDNAEDLNDDEAIEED
jgi:hypothetical protein